MALSPVFGDCSCYRILKFAFRFYDHKKKTGPRIEVIKNNPNSRAGLFWWAILDLNQ